MAQLGLKLRRALVGAIVGVAALMSVSVSSQTNPTDTRPVMTENWASIPPTPWGRTYPWSAIPRLARRRG